MLDSLSSLKQENPVNYKAGSCFIDHTLGHIYMWIR